MINVNEIMRSAIEQRALVDPRDLRDSEFYMSQATIDEVARQVGAEYPSPHHLTSLLGVSLRAGDNMPDGMVRLVTETELDRTIRRAADLGRTVQVVKPVAPLPEVVPVPDPTLRALLKHWWKKVTK